MGDYQEAWQNVQIKNRKVKEILPGFARPEELFLGDGESRKK